LSSRALLLACALAGAALAAAAAGAAAQQRQPAQKSKDARGGPKPAPAQRPKVTEIDEAALKSLLGTSAGRERPLLVNFWATWCGPCREEFPDLVKIRGQYAPDRLDFALVSLDDPVDISTVVPDFLSEQRAGALPAYLLHAVDDGNAINMVDPTWGGELPATFLYDRSGALVFKHKGRIKPDELRAALDEALKGKPRAASAPK
jgi:thiol-disulfide isomerase/thioredoxin